MMVKDSKKILFLIVVISALFLSNAALASAHGDDRPEKNGCPE